MDSNQEDETKRNLSRAGRGVVVLVSDILNLLSVGQTVKDIGPGHTANCTYTVAHCVSYFTHRMGI